MTDTNLYALTDDQARIVLSLIADTILKEGNSTHPYLLQANRALLSPIVDEDLVYRIDAIREASFSVRFSLEKGLDGTEPVQESNENVSKLRKARKQIDEAIEKLETFVIPQAEWGEDDD